MSPKRTPLYPDYRPAGIRRGWEHCSMSCDATCRDLLVRYGALVEWGTPIEAVAWFDMGSLRCLIADYAGGRRAELRISTAGYRFSTYLTNEQNIADR